MDPNTEAQIAAPAPDQAVSNSVSTSKVEPAATERGPSDTRASTEVEKNSGKKARQASSKTFFNEEPIPFLRVSLPPESWQMLTRNPRVYVRGSIQEGDTVYPEVGLHLKGRLGSFRPLHDKPALTVKFNKFRKGQKFHGLEKIHLNNSVQDRTYMTENLCGRIFREAGAPAPRVTNARVQLNGRDLGFYVLLEGFTEDFLGMHFENTDGNLYDFPFKHDIFSPQVKETRNRPPADLRALTLACQDPQPQRRLERIGQLLDLNRFYTYMALEVMMWDWDGYPMFRNNFRVYHDPTSNKIVFFPHGMDQMFRNPHGPILPTMQGLVAQAIIETPEGRQRYFERIAALLSAPFTAERMIGYAEEIRARIRPVLMAMSPSLAQQHDQQVARLCESIAERVSSLHQQIQNPPLAPVSGSRSRSRRPTLR